MVEGRDEMRGRGGVGGRRRDEEKFYWEQVMIRNALIWSHVNVGFSSWWLHFKCIWIWSAVLLWASRLTLHEYNIKTLNHEGNMRLMMRPARLGRMFDMCPDGGGCARETLSQDLPQVIHTNHSLLSFAETVLQTWFTSRHGIQGWLRAANHSGFTTKGTHSKSEVTHDNIFLL